MAYTVELHVILRKYVGLFRLFYFTFFIKNAVTQSAKLRIFHLAMVQCKLAVSYCDVITFKHLA